MNNIHFAPNYFFNQTHPISIILIGVGGTGSLVLSRLARLDFALKELGHPGIYVTAFDSDIVERNNIGRQNFSINDIGENKAFALIGKINTNFGLNWKAVPQNYTINLDTPLTSNIFITCVDNGIFRDSFNDWFLKNQNNYNNYLQPYYWLDLGNSRKQGQIVLGSVTIEQPKSKIYKTKNKLKSIVELFGKTQKHDTIELQGNSCSYNSKLHQQSLFINDVISAFASDLLFELIHNKMTEKQGMFLNLENFKSNPILV
jgi:PRTRC genetic system ThiF family protein